MSVGIDKSLAVIGDLKGVIVGSVALIRGGISLSQVLMLAGSVNQLVQDSKGALPELSDIDPAEAGKLCEAAYGAVKEVIKALSK